MSDAHSAGAALVITEAVARFKHSVSPDDRAQIESTELKDVLDALINIQEYLQNKRENRNLRKLYPFVEGLERYSGVLDTLSNGLSPYLPWIWAPIKLMLRITLDYLSAFDKLIDAYGLIATTMPRLKNLGNAFKDSPALLTKLALYYVDVLEFHRRAYKFVRRKSWVFFFNTTWANFDFQFNSILASMARHSEAIDREAATIDIIEAKEWRDKLALQVAAKENDRVDRQRQSVVAWLALENPPQEDSGEKLLRDCLQGSCDWLLKQEKVASWVKIDSKLPVLWLHGKPGAENDTDLSTMAFTDFVQKYREPSLKVLRTMLIGAREKPGLLHGVPTCRILIDGLDECDPAEQKYIVEDLLQLTSANSKNCNCKLLISSRDVPEISRTLWKKKRDIGVISLSQEHDSLNRTIKMFVESRLKDLVEERTSFQMGDKEVDGIVDIMTSKADGMFLWAKLVLDSLSDVDSIRELHAAITSMPRELPRLYTRIIENLAKDGRADKVMRVLAWLAFSKRPLRRHELLHGASLTPGAPFVDGWDTFDESVIDKCKPLVEELSDGSIALVHFTVEEYLRTDSSAQHLDSAVWEEAIAFACVTVLKDGLHLLDPELPDLSLLPQILNGSFALLPYAIDFWLEHVLFHASSTILRKESVLGQALSSLELFHGKLCSSLKPHTPGEACFSTHVSDDVRLEKLSHLSVYSLCASILAFRANCQGKSASNGKEFEELTLQEDMTLFSTLSVRFTEIVNQLLSEGFTRDGISKDQLDRFRNQYLQFPLRCRFAPCARVSLGFASETLRASHEQLHVKRLFCDKPNCSRGRIGFRHQKDLDVHKRTYHEQGSILVPPRVRKTFKADMGGRGISNISPDDRLFLPDENSCPALPDAMRKNTVKYKALQPFDSSSIKEAFSKWSEIRQNGEFAVMLNEKFKSSLDVNLIYTFGPNHRVWSLDISPDDRLLARGSSESAQVVDIQTGETKYEFKIDISGKPRHDYVQAVAFYDNGCSLVIGSESGYITRSFAISKALAGRKERSKGIDMTGDKTVKIWNLRVETGPRPLMTIPAEDTVNSVAVSRDSRLLATGCFDNSVSLWSLQNGNLLQRFAAHTDSVYSVSFSPDSRTLISSSLDTSIMTWDSDPADPQNKFSLQPSKQMTLHQDFALSSLMTTDGRWIISASEDSSIVFWDAETGGPHLILLGHGTSVEKLASGHSSHVFASGSSDGAVKIWSYNA
ncbi:hypothetical protein O1611_g2810 [Lasiodiplodia mahajangana]|uniref:Uncharacterized protein n=1 Tax=Lasiodiplodia mahajangana TaxID=1108764 RepID=A0ACC2JU82_9PEZI|nr:hypothetical protein O1611_g2810 [Lasiodiplodia mahajangana]